MAFERLYKTKSKFSVKIKTGDQTCDQFESFNKLFSDRSGTHLITI